MADVIEAGKHETVEQMIRAAHKYLEETGDVISPSKVSKLIRRFHRESASGVPFESWAWVYADPTGIRAGKRVDRQRAKKAAS